MDIARLGLAVDSSPVEKGTVALHQLTGAAGQASAAARQLAGASSAEAVGHRTATAATQAHTAALMANNAAMRGATAQRTNLIFQLNDIGVSLASGMNPLMVAIQQGSQIATIYGPGEGGIGRAFRETGNIAATVATKFWPIAAAIGVVAAGLAGLTYEINQASDVTVSMGDVALATWQVISTGIYNFVKPAIDAIGPAFKQAWDFSVEFTVNALEAIVRAAAGAVVVIKAGFSSIAPALKIAGETGANFFLSAFDVMVNEALKGIQRLLEGLRLLQPAARLIPNVYRASEPFATGRVDIGGAAAADQMAQTWSRDVPEQLASTAQWSPLRDLFGAIREQAEQNALGRATEGLNEMAGAAQAANDNISSLALESERLAQAWGQSVRSAWNGFFQEFKTGLTEGKSGWEAFGSAAMNALDRLSSKALEMATNGIFDMLFGSLMGGFGRIGQGGVGIPSGGFIPGLTGPSLPSFDGGGFTGNGSRSGGLDGRGGFAAMLHRNETVIDHTKPAANSNGPMNIHLTVTATVDKDGNIVPIVENVSARTSARSIPVAVEQSKAEVGKGIRGGDYDGAFSSYGMKQQARRRK
jgi:hypothetical protein